MIMATSGDLATRKANWSLEETNALVDSVVQRWQTIKGKFSPSLTTEKKNKAWQEVSESVNACSKSSTRDVKCIKKKWTDLQSSTRKREAERRRDAVKTGGGPAPPSLKEWEDKILSVVNDGVIIGVEGGFDAQSGFQGAFSELEDTAAVGPSGDSMTSTTEKESPSNAKASSTNEKTAGSSDDNEDIEEISNGSCSLGKKRRMTQSSNNMQDYSSRLLKIEEEKLEIKKQKLILERRKVEALEGILKELKKKDESCAAFSPELFSVTPTISFQ